MNKTYEQKHGGRTPADDGSDAARKEILDSMAEDLAINGNNLTAPKRTVETILAKQDEIFTNGETWESYQEKAMTGEIHDDDNPAFLFQTINISILKMIVNGDVNAIALAKKELESRG